MEFALTDEQRMIAETAQSFFRENATSKRTRKAMAGAKGFEGGIDRELWGGFCSELGLAGVGLPEEHGGAGLGMIEFAIVAEAAGAQIAAIPLLGHAMVARAIAAGGSNAQRDEWLPRLAAGELICTTSSAPKIEVGDDGRLSQTFPFLPHGAASELLLAWSGDDAWIVDLKGEGASVTSHVTMDQTRPLATATLKKAVAERLEDGNAAIVAALSTGWLCLAAEALGGAQECLDRTVAYSRERVQFGRAIGSFQAYKHRLADMMIEIEQARSAVYWAACAIDEQSGEASLALHAAKSFAADTYFMCAGNMIQLHGGIGFTWEHDAHLFFKRARSIQSMLGDGNFHREQVAAMALEAAA